MLKHSRPDSKLASTLTGPRSFSTSQVTPIGMPRVGSSGLVSIVTDRFLSSGVAVHVLDKYEKGWRRYGNTKSQNHASNPDGGSGVGSSQFIPLVAA